MNRMSCSAAFVCPKALLLHWHAPPVARSYTALAMAGTTSTPDEKFGHGATAYHIVVCLFYMFGVSVDTQQFSNLEQSIIYTEANLTLVS